MSDRKSRERSGAADPVERGGLAAPAAIAAALLVAGGLTDFRELGGGPKAIGVALFAAWGAVALLRMLRRTKAARGLAVAALVATLVLLPVLVLSDPEPERFDAEIVLSERGDAALRGICGPESRLRRGGALPAEVDETTLDDDYVSFSVRRPSCARVKADVRLPRADVLAVRKR